MSANAYENIMAAQEKARNWFKENRIRTSTRKVGNSCYLSVQFLNEKDESNLEKSYEIPLYTEAKCGQAEKSKADK